MIKVGPGVLSMEEINARVLENANSVYRQIAADAGTIDSILKMGEQLATDDILMRPLTIERVEISRAVDEKTKEVKLYPVMVFKEYPGAYYSGGTMLKKTIDALAIAFGDNPATDLRLPKLNEHIDSEGGPVIVIYKPEGKDYYVPAILG